MSESDSEKRSDKAAAPKKKPARSGGALESKAVEAGKAGGKTKAKGSAVKPVDSVILGKDDGKTSPATPKSADTGKVTMAAPTAAAATVAGTSPKPSDEGEKTVLSGPSSPSSTRSSAETANTASTSGTGGAGGSGGETLTDKAPKSPPPPVPVAQVQRVGFWPVALGGVVAAGIGALATIWALPYLPQSWVGGQAVDADAIRADAVAAAKDEIATQAEGFQAAAAASGAEAARAVLAEAPQATAPAGDGPSADQVAALQAQVDEQAKLVAELVARPALDPEAAARVQSLSDQAAALQEQIATAAEQAQATITAAQSEAEKLQDAATASTRRAEAVAAVAALQAALDQGVSTDPAVQGLRDAGVEPPAAVTAEVPTLLQLQDSFDGAARAALQAALKVESPDAGPVGAIGNFLRVQTGARSVEPREGTDADAILSRAGAGVAAGDIATALNEIETLPEPALAAPAMAEWLTDARAFVGAHAALESLAGESN